MPSLARPSVYRLAAMHESVPELRRVPSTGAYCADEDEDEEYDVYYFYPSRNQLSLHPVFDDDWDDETGSESTVSDYSVTTSPTYSVDPNFNFADTVDDVGISSMGYSLLFRRGLWAQSSPITKKLGALIKQAVARLQSFKKHFVRDTAATDV